MKQFSHRLSVLVLVLLLLALAAPTQAAAESDWEQWRGPLGTGEAPEADPPVEWSETKNVRFKVELPGLGSSTPVISGDRIFVTTAIDTGGGEGRIKAEGDVEWVLLALDRETGAEVWRRVVKKAKPHEGTHPDGTFASSSALIDGKTVYAYFGSEGLYAFDFDGNELWQRDFGDMNIRLGFGEGSSPAFYKNRLVVNWDHEGDSSIFVVDAETGDDVWQRERDEATSWASPVIVEVDGKAQVITSATNKVRAYDLASGDVVWEAKGMTLNAIPTPIYDNGVVYLTSGFRGNAFMAIRISGASGDITDSDRILWTLDRDTPYVPSALLYKGLLYFFKSNNPLLTAVRAESGETVFGPQRIDGLKGVYASPIGAAGRVYLVGRQGGTVVIEAGDEFKVLATNKLDDGFDASPVAVGKDLFLRGRKHLYRISNQ